MKKTLIMPVSLLFFHNVGPNLAQMLLQDHSRFFWLVSNDMLGDSSNINNCNSNPVVLKKN